MKILLLGSTGMAGSALKKSLELRGQSVVGVARTNSDYNCDLSNESNLFHILNMHTCLLYTSPSPRDRQKSRMPSSA